MKLLPIPFFFFLFLLSTTTNAQVITTVAGNGTLGSSGDNGFATAAELDHPRDITIDTSGNIYIADGDNGTVRKVDAAGVITTIAGIADYYDYNGDNIPATDAGIGGVYSIAFDKKKNLYILDAGNYRVRKIDTSGIITTIAGNSSHVYNGDTIAATAASLTYPIGIAIDKNGSIYIGERNGYRIRKIDTFGIITTIAGNGMAGSDGDEGPAIMAKVTPSNIAIDSNNNIFFADSNKIRKIDTAGVITTVAGTGIAGYSGDGGPATTASITEPTGLKIDRNNCLYLFDLENYRVRKVSADGMINTIAGTGSPVFYNDHVAPLHANLDGPVSGAFDTAGNLFIVTLIDSRVRAIKPGIEETAVYLRQQTEIFPNPSNGSMTIPQEEAIDGVAQMRVLNAVGAVVYSSAVEFRGGKADVNMNNVVTGLYIVELMDSNGQKFTTKMVVQQ